MKVSKGVVIGSRRSGNRCGVTYFWRGEFTCQNVMVFIDRKMQSTPGAPSRNIVFFLAPCVFAIDLESGGIDNYGSIALVRICLGKVMLRLEMLLKSGIVISAFMTRASEFMKPSVWRNGR
jgi:hypothetical protein